MKPRLFAASSNSSFSLSRPAASDDLRLFDLSVTHFMDLDLRAASDSKLVGQ
jgi:hypothetical protein